jgi:chromosome segregation ATPase
MIDDMVALLKKEQEDDETHKEYCNTEFDTSEDEQKATEQKLEALASSISSMKDEIASLGEKIAALTAENAALDKSVAEATATRKEENADFLEKVQLNEAAIALIFKAKNRLQKFYNPDQYVEAEKAEPTEEEMNHSFKVSFLQMKSVSLHKQNNGNNDAAAPPPMPEVGFEGAYQAKGQKSNSVMALMDMLTKDLEKDNQESEHDEKVAQKEYAELLTDAQETKAANSKGIQDKSKSKADLETSLEDTKTKKIMADDQLANVKSYVEDLHASCDFIMANFEIRREARSGEIDSLANAKAVLNGASFSL